MDVVLEHIPSLELERKLDGLHHCKLVLGLDGQLGHSSFLVHRHIEFVGWIDKLGQHCNISLKVSIFSISKSCRNIRKFSIYYQEVFDLL